MAPTSLMEKMIPSVRRYPMVRGISSPGVHMSVATVFPDTVMSRGSSP